MRTKIELLIAVLLIAISFAAGYKLKDGTKKLVYSGSYNFMDFELKENKPQVHTIYKQINSSDVDDLVARARSPIVVTVDAKKKGFFTSDIDGIATDGYKGTEFSYEASATPSGKYVFGGIVLIAILVILI